MCLCSCTCLRALRDVLVCACARARFPCTAPPGLESGCCVICTARGAGGTAGKTSVAVGVGTDSGHVWHQVACSGCHGDKHRVEMEAWCIQVAPPGGAGEPTCCTCRRRHSWSDEQFLPDVALRGDVCMFLCTSCSSKMRSPGVRLTDISRVTCTQQSRD